MIITVLDITDSLVSVECYIPKDLVEDNIRYTKDDKAINEVLSKLNEKVILKNPKYFKDNYTKNKVPNNKF